MDDASRDPDTVTDQDSATGTDTKPDGGESHPARPKSQKGDPAEVFALLGDETRLAIIARLNETDAGPVSFSTLNDAVGLADSGQFNYHLEKLLGRFVSKTSEGYRLTSAGRRVARAVQAGLYTESVSIDPFAIDGACLHCGARDLVASYTDERFHIDCEDCGADLLRVAAPPSLVRGRPPQEALAAFERWSILQVEIADDHDLCPYCAGPVERTLTHDPPVSSFKVLPTFVCTVCGGQVMTSFGSLAARLPTVRAFRERHGLERAGERYWESDETVTDRHVEIHPGPPWRAEITFVAERAVCRVLMDERLEARQITMETRSDEDGDGGSAA